MANTDFTKPAVPGHSKGVDPLALALVYRMRCDAMMIVANMNRGCDAMSMETTKRQLVFVQSQLCLAALADPQVPQWAKTQLANFQSRTVHENLKDRRGARLRDRNYQAAV